MKLLYLKLGLILVLSTCSCVVIREETYKDNSDISPLIIGKSYVFSNLSNWDTLKLDLKKKDQFMLEESIWKHVKPFYNPKHNNWKRSNVKIEILNRRKANFKLINQKGQIIGNKTFRYKRVDNFIEIRRQLLMDPGYVLLWVLGSQKMALGINAKSELKILKERGGIIMLVIMPTFGGGNLDVGEFKPIY